MILPPHGEGLGERYLAGRGITPEQGLDEKLRCMTLPDGSAYLKSAYSLPEPHDEILRDILRGIEEFYLAECPPETRRARSFYRAALAAREWVFPQPPPEMSALRAPH